MPCQEWKNHVEPGSCIQMYDNAAKDVSKSDTLSLLCRVLPTNKLVKHSANEPMLLGSLIRDRRAALCVGFGIVSLVLLEVGKHARLERRSELVLVAIHVYCSQNDERRRRREYRLLSYEGHRSTSGSSLVWWKMKTCWVVQRSSNNGEGVG